MKSIVSSVVALSCFLGAICALSIGHAAIDTNLNVTLTRQNQNAVLSWFGSNAIAYQVEASSNLTVWSNFGPALPGNNVILFSTNPIALQSQRFFRVLRMTTTISATFNPGTGVLTITGDNQPNIIVVSRNAAGNILINGGLVAITGGTPTVANTTLIQIFGGAGNDQLALDESNGALPRANMFGEADNDILIGGSGADVLNGGAGDDTLLGKGGADILTGGDNNDTLTGGDGDDQVFGEAGNDRLIWNPGDDTDLNEGGSEIDTVEVNGGNGAEDFTVTANGTRVRFDRINPAPFSLDINACENLVLNANGGNDTFSGNGNLATLIQITVDGGPGDDTLLGSNGADILLGGDDNDFIDGNQGNDMVFLGAGDDVFQWDPGDGLDTVDGQAGADRLEFNGAAIGEAFDFSTTNGTHLRFTRNVASIALELVGIESVNVNALGGADVVTVNDISATDVTNVTLRLAGLIGGNAGDGQVDSVVINGTSLSNNITATQTGADVSVFGLKPLVTIFTGETNDLITLNGLGGNDTIDASGITSLFAPTLDGGPGDDTIIGSSRADSLFGGDDNDTITGRQGNDTVFGGNGNDTFVWNPGDGNDVLEGQAGTDTLRFNGSSVSEILDAVANGTRFLLLRNVGNVTLDCDEVEQVQVNLLSGADNFNIGELTTTDVKDLLVDLGSPSGSGTGDAAADNVTLNGTQTNDVITVSGTASKVTATGLSAALTIIGMEAANDTLTINALGGADTVDGSSLIAGIIKTTINGGLGNDTLIGSQGGDSFNGGDGNDTVFGGGGDDTLTWNPGDDNDIFEGQAGNDTLQFNGANIAENISVSANGSRLLFFRDIANVVLDCNDVETVRFEALGGADNITINNLATTDVTAVNINLAGTLGGNTGDGVADTITVNGTAAADTLTVVGASGSVSVLGLPATVTLTSCEAANDRITINTLGGDDIMDASGLPAGIISLTADGGINNDFLIGSDGADTLLGSDGDDTLIGGPGVDVLDGGAGSNTVIQ